MEAQLTLIAESLANQPELVKTFIGEMNGVPTTLVDARELHAFLENGERFASWIKTRVEKWNFKENEEFKVFRKIPKNSKGGRPSVDFHVTLEMAKELSMVENNIKGKEARLYFIEMEKRALAAMGQMVPHSHAETLTPSEQRTIQELVKYKTANVDSQQRRKAMAEIYSRLNNKFRVAKYSQIARTQLADAIAYVMEMSVKAAAPKQEKLGEVGAYIIQQFSDVMAQYLSKNRAHNIASVLHEEMQRRFGCAVRDVPVSEVGKIVSSIGELCDDTFRVWSLSSLMENWVQMEWDGYRSAMPEGVRYALENIEIPALAKIPEVSIKKRAAMMLGI